MVVKIKLRLHGHMKGSIIECPYCGAPVYPIQYGEPCVSEEVYFKKTGKHVIYGGCCISDNDATYECSKCHRRFNPNHTRYFLPLVQKMADAYAMNNGYCFAEIKGKRNHDYYFRLCSASSEPMCTGLMLYFVIINEDTLKLKYDEIMVEEVSSIVPIHSRIGERIFKAQIRALEKNELVGKDKEFWERIVGATSPYTYDIPIDMQDLYTYLAAAKRLNKKVEIIPDSEFQEGGSRYDQCDGWSYHIELK